MCGFVYSCIKFEGKDTTHVIVMVIPGIVIFSTVVNVNFAEFIFKYKPHMYLL